MIMRRMAVSCLGLLAALVLCGPVGGAPMGSVDTSSLGGTASISLTNASAGATLTSDHQWTLTKTGSVSGSTVTWQINATSTATVTGQLVLRGAMTVTNSGAGPATIGNIVVNLQTRVNNQWKSVSSDVADATDGDAATTANIHAAASAENRSSFAENAASGSLQFTDATNNTLFSLVPEMFIAAGETRSLLFQATFDNNVLQLAPGTPIRSEVIVSFGNASVNGNSTADIDINGNAQIDFDEAHIRSVPSRVTLTVPATTPGNATATLSDTPADIATTGTVTISSTSFNLGATDKTVTATVNGGANGGTITNCAHLTSPGQTVTSGGFTFTQVGALNLQACNTQTIGATTCTAGAVGCGWSTNDERSLGEFNWDSSTGGAPLLTSNYSAVYAANAGVFTIGVVGATTYSMSFTSVNALLAYLPATGTAGPLNSDLVNPTTSSSGQFGGDVAALKLNIDFSDRDLLAHSSGTAFGDLLLCGVTPASLDGSSVRALLSEANGELGAQSTFSPDVAQLVNDVNGSFLNGSPSSFAEAHLFVGTCPAAGKLVTYNQDAYGDPLSAGGTLLGANFNAQFGQGLVIGIDGTAGFSATFSMATAVWSFLPQSDPPGVLTADTLDPDTTHAGTLGGDLVALTLNVVFSDGGVLGGTASSRLGDLYICGTSVTAVNNHTVRDFLAMANTLVGSGGAPFSVAVADSFAILLNDAFSGGSPSTFAQSYLFVGACPWEPGNLVTYGQVAWDSDSAATSVLTNNYGIYAPSGIVEIGIPGTAGYSIRFSTPNAILNFLPAIGNSGSPLNSDLANPTTSVAGLFAGDVLALKLDIDFSASGALGGTSATEFGDLTLCNMTQASLDNLTVSGYLALVNRLLGGDTTTGYTISDLAVTTAELANAFGGGTVTTFAVDHLRIGSCN
jgi:hypothetical protein